MAGDNAGLPPAAPLDIRMGVTSAADVKHPLRWGIIGTGNISRMWVQALAAVPGASVTAVAGRTPERVAAFAARHGIARVHESYEALAAADDVDIIYVGTITPLHKQHSLLALAAGKHVLCEKPLAEHADDAAAMYAAADRQRVMLQDAMWTRFFPAVEHARWAIEAGVIGDPVLVQADFFDPIYTIQAAPLAFGADARPTSVVHAGGAASAAVVAYGEDRCAVFTFPPFGSELPEETHLVGTKGRITLEQPGHCPTALSIRVPPAVPSRYRTANVPAPVQRFEYPLPGNVAMPNAFPNQHGFLYQAEAVHRCIAAGLRETPQYPKAESLHAMAVLTQIQALRKTAYGA